jgi:hypothetical protein
MRDGATAIFLCRDVKLGAVDELTAALDPQDAVLRVIGPRGGRLANGKVEATRRPRGPTFEWWASERHRWRGDGGDTGESGSRPPR